MMTVRPRVTLAQLAALCALLALGTLQAPRTSATSLTAHVIELTNAQRRAFRGDGCPALVANDALAHAAEQHAVDMARHNYLSHNSRSGASPWQRMRRAGYRPTRAAENIAAGQSSPEAVVGLWMSSPHHRANILDCRLREIGVGFAEGPGTIYGTYWVQAFGTRR